MRKTEHGNSQPSMKKRLTALTNFKDKFCSPGFVAGTRIERDNDRSFSYMTYSPSVVAFVNATYKYKWVLLDFDWMSWLDEVKFEELTSLERIAEASVEDLERLLTVIVREERIAEGSLCGMFEEGVVQAIVERAAVMAREREV